MISRRLGLLLLWTCSVQAANPFMACRQAWEDTLAQKVRPITQRIQTATGQTLPSLRPQAQRIFTKLHGNPTYALTASEKKYLQTMKLDHTFEQYRKAHELEQKINLALALWDGTDPALKHKGLEKYWFGTWNLLLPVLPNIHQERVARIFNEAIKNPTFKMSPKDYAFLKKHGLLKKLQLAQENAKKHPEAVARISDVHVVGHNLKWGITLSAVAVGALGNRFISSKESFNENSPDGMSRYDEKVELIFLSPMPHASIRMGGLVYNYGAFFTNRYTLEQFRANTGYGEKLSGSHTRIELKLTPEEKAELRSYLEEDVKKVYPLIFPYNDCVSETNKAVSKATNIDVPPILDRSQAGTIAYYKMMKLLYPERVGEIRFASLNDNGIQDKAMDSAIGTLDMLFFLKHAGEVTAAACIIDRGHTTVEIKQKKLSN